MNCSAKRSNRIANCQTKTPTELKICWGSFLFSFSLLPSEELHNKSKKSYDKYYYSGSCKNLRNDRNYRFKCSCPHIDPDVNGVQNGSIKAVVSVEVFDVTFNPNGGILNGTTSNTVVASQIAIPELAGYVPTREGGYVFDGWYVADGNGNMTDVRALSNEVLYSDVILVAKWREPITIKGTVAVAGVYELEDGKHEIPDHDRIKSGEETWRPSALIHSGILSLKSWPSYLAPT